MTISNKAVQEFKVIFEKEYGKKLTDSEARDAGQRLVDFFSLLIDIDIEEQKRKRKLKEFPDGFPVDGSYSCRVCGSSINETTGWYDWFGQTCLICHKAIKDGVVPAFICRQSNSCYKPWELKSKFGIHYQSIKKLVRENKLVARAIMNGDHIHEYIFLKKENPNLIDPDKHTPGRKSYDRNRDKVAKEKTREYKSKNKS